MFKHRGKGILVLICVALIVLGSLSACKKEEAEIVFEVDKLKQQCNALTLQAVEGDVSPIFEKIKEANIEEADKNFYLNIMKHELIFSIFPYTDLDESANLKLETCQDCHEDHGNYPPLIFDKMQQLKKHFLREELPTNNLKHDQPHPPKKGSCLDLYDI